MRKCDCSHLLENNSVRSYFHLGLHSNTVRRSHSYDEISARNLQDMVKHCSSKRPPGFHILQYVVQFLLIILSAWNNFPESKRFSNGLLILQATPHYIGVILSSFVPSIFISAVVSELLFNYSFFHVLFHPWGHPICFWRVDFILCNIFVLLIAGLVGSLQL